MKRISAYSTALLLLLVWSALPFAVGGTPIGRSIKAVGIKRESSSSPRPRVTIVFRGLMILHPEPTHQYFEAGILPARGHDFKIEVRENSPAGVSSFSVPVERFASLEHDA